MIYFRTVQLQDPTKEQVEKAIRKLALRRDNSIDFVATGTNIGTDKRFIGTESTQYTKFTRIRYSIEEYLPKLIISFPKAEDHKYYKVRLALKSFVIFCFLSSMLVITFISSLFHSDAINIFEGIFIADLIFTLLIFFEIKQTQRSINVAISKMK